MRCRSTAKSLQQKAYTKLFRQYKSLYHRIGSLETERIVFIFGCQRSGTTMLQQIFSRDINSKVYDEVGSALSRHDSKLGLRLDPIEELYNEFNKPGAPLIVVKPLVESQNARQLLQSFPKARAIWMYRHYADVVASKLKKSGLMSGIGDLRHMVKKTPNDWRSDRIPMPIYSLVQKHFAEDMNGYDAAALYWYVRNHFYFEQALDNLSTVMLCRYEELVREPQEGMKRIYAFLERPFPNPRNMNTVHTDSIGKGKAVTISPSIKALCDEMLEALIRADRHAQRSKQGAAL